MDVGLAQTRIFEVNVINNLDAEAIFVQVRAKANVNYSSASACVYRQPIISNAAMLTPILGPSANHAVTHPITNVLSGLNLNGFNGSCVNQRYLNQHRAFMTHGNASHSRIINEEPQAAIPTIPRIQKTRVVKAKPKSSGFIKNKEASRQSIDAGFVRIVPFQSLSFPVVVDDKLNFSYITVYVQDLVSSELVCIANQLPINRQDIEIKKTEDGDIVIQYSQNHINNLLISWSLPQYLCNAMKNNGWTNIDLWHALREDDLIEMGFRKPHRLIFFDKFADLLRNPNQSELVKSSCVKDILKSWNLPIYLYSSMVDNGWIDPYDWREITDQHFAKMGFQDGHAVKFRKHVVNDDHIVLFENMQAAMKKERKFINEMESKTESKTESNSDSNQIDMNNLINSRFAHCFNQSSYASIPTFKIDPTTVTHEQFEYNLEKLNVNARYYLETKSGNDSWQNCEEIIDTKRRNVGELEMNTAYLIRIRAENKRENKVTYSSIIQLQTKNEQWKNLHLPKIPAFKYAVSSNNKQITVEFEAQSLEQIKQTKFDERYSLDIGLSKDQGLEKIVNWKNVATVRKDKLVYKYNVNDQKAKSDWIHVGISARNDLGQRYNQCTPTRQFPFNQVIKRINTTKHGNNLEFNESMTVATKIDQDYKYSTFAFGQPITNEMCNRYDMYVKVNKLQSDCFMGYAPSLDGVINWNQALGYGSNKNSSVGVLANKATALADLAVYNKDGGNKRFVNDRSYPRVPSTLPREEKWDDGSVFVLSFDFLNDDCNIYLNENNDGINHDHNTLDRNRLLKSIKLNKAKSVVPSFSLNYVGDSIEVVKWRLY